MNQTLLYIRVSSKEQEKEGFSLDAQEKLGIDYALRHGLKIVKTWKVQESAWSNKKARTAFDQMIDYAKRHDDIKHIIFDITDRMTRNDFDKIKIFTLIKEHNKTIHFSRSNKTLDSNATPEDIFMTDIEVAVAKKQSNDISRKSQMGMLEKAEQGFYPSTAPFGYRNNKVTRLIEIDHENKIFIQKTFEQMATGNYSLNMLCDWLFDNGFKSKGGKKIYKSALDKILKNPIYYGAFRWRGKLYTGNHEPIISKQLFNEVQDVLNGKTKPHKGRKNFAFANILLCGDCGCKVLGEEKKKQYIYYHCSFSRGRHNGAGYIPENRLAGMFEDSVQGATLSQKQVDWLMKACEKRYKNTATIEQNRLLRLQTEHDKVNTRLNKLYDSKFDGEIPEDIFKLKESEYNGKLIEIKSLLEKCGKTNPRFFEDAEQILELSKSMRSLYVKANYHEKAHLLKLIASNYTLTDVSICPTYRKPFSSFNTKGSRSRWLPRVDSNHGQAG